METASDSVSIKRWSHPGNYQSLTNPTTLKEQRGEVLSAMEVFTRLRTSMLIIRSIPLRKYKKLETLNEERTKKLINIVGIQ